MLSKSFSVQITVQISNLLFETLHGPPTYFFHKNLEVPSARPSNLSLCIYCLNLCLSKLKWNDNGETKLHVTSSALSSVTLVSHQPFLPFFNLPHHSQRTNCKSDYAITLFKTQCL